VLSTGRGPVEAATYIWKKTNKGANSLLRHNVVLLLYVHVRRQRHTLVIVSRTLNIDITI